MARIVKDMEIDEISLVDRPANQHAKVLISKRDGSEEDHMGDEIYDEEGNLVDVDDLEEGDVIYDADGEAFVVTVEDEMEYDDEPVGKSFSEELRESLSKAVSDRDRDYIIAKAQHDMGLMAEQVAYAEEIAKAERDLRLMKEYEEVAKNYSLPVDEQELAPALMAIAEYLPYEVGEIIHKALTVAGSIYEEIGFAGGADNNDVLTMVDSYIDENISKADISKAEAVEAIFATNPDAYDEYMRTR